MTSKQHTGWVNFFQFLPFVSFLQDTCSWVIDVDTITGELCWYIFRCRFSCFLTRGKTKKWNFKVFGWCFDSGKLNSFFLVVTSCNASHLLLAASLAKFFFRLIFSTSCIATDLHLVRCRQRNDIAQHLWELNRHQLFFKKWNSPKKSSTVVKVSLTLRLVVAVCCYRDHIKNSHVAAKQNNLLWEWGVPCCVHFLSLVVEYSCVCLSVHTVCVIWVVGEGL